MALSSTAAANPEQSPLEGRRDSDQRKGRAGPAVRRLEGIGWLTASQRSGILYDNAARFLRLDAPTIARHHGR